MFLSACAALRDPALDDLFVDEAGSAVSSQRPVIVMPGVLGTRLMDAATGDTVWPPTLLRALSGRWDAHGLALPIQEEPRRLVPTNVMLSMPFIDFYTSLVEALSALGYQCVPEQEVDRDTNCVLFGWDWRHDFVDSAARLDELIDRIRSARDEPELKVDIVAHSAGALIARYYARFGGRDVLDQERGTVTVDSTSAVRRAVLIGPPNNGSIFGLQRLMRGDRVGPVEVPPEVIATFGTAYQLLPHPERDWMIDLHGQPAARDLYDVETWRIFEESIFNPDVRERLISRSASVAEGQRKLRALQEQFGRLLARGKRFHEVLSLSLPDDAGVEYVVLGSDCTPTAQRCLLEEEGAQPALRLHPDEVSNRVQGVDYERLMLAPGDGRVTRNFALAREYRELQTGRASSVPVRYFAFACESHMELVSNFEIQHNLLNFLLH